MQVDHHIFHLGVVDRALRPAAPGFFGLGIAGVQADQIDLFEVDELKARSEQLMRVHIPEMEKTYFLKVSLPDGEIDYRFAMAAMLDAGYQGYMAIEGWPVVDALYSRRYTPVLFNGAPVNVDYVFNIKLVLPNR